MDSATARSLELRGQIEEIFDAYLEEVISGDLPPAPRAVAVERIVQLVESFPEPAGLAQAWAVLARTLAGDHQTSRQLRAVLSELIELLDLARSLARNGAAPLSPEEEARLRRELRRQGFDVALYRGADRAVFIGAPVYGAEVIDG